MSAFETRDHWHAELLAELTQLLEQAGWRVASYGQALLSDEARAILRGLPNAWHRWLPDLIAQKRDEPAKRILVDAKSCAPKHRKSEYHMIEDAALAALTVHEQTASMPVYIVFHDHRAVRPFELSRITLPGLPQQAGGPGSGKPYSRVFRDEIPHAFDELIA